MWKTYIQSMIDFGSQVWCPVDPSNIMNLESVLRHYTERIQGMENMSYWERLQSLKMNSIQRRFERYRIIYIWQILNGNVPNFGITFSKNERRGMMVNIPVLNSKVKASVKTLREQSLLVYGGRMFNLLPVKMRNFIGPKEEFKIMLDKFLEGIPDQPLGPGLYPEPISRITCSNSNSVTDWIYHLNLMDRRPDLSDDS